MSNRNASLADRPRLAETVTDYVIGRVAGRVLRPGDALPSESDLARLLNVSKPVVREGMGRLAALGLVSIQQGKPTTIRALSAGPFQDLLRMAVQAHDHGLREAIELRRALETEVAALAAERATAAQLEHLAETIADMRANIGNLDRWLDGDFAFHQALVRAAENSLLELFFAALSQVMRYSMRLLGRQADMFDPHATLAHHEAILAAVVARDAPAARAAMERHFRSTRKLVDAIGRDASRRAGLETPA